MKRVIHELLLMQPNDGEVSIMIQKVEEAYNKTKQQKAIDAHTDKTKERVS